MYATDQPIVAKHATTVAGFVDTLNMVSLSIRNPWHKVGSMLKDVDKNGAGSIYLKNGTKAAFYAYVTSHAVSLKADCDALAAAGDTVGLIYRLTQIPGLGIVKAGFVAQLVYGVGGCLDCHNLKRLGLKESAFKLTGKEHLDKTRIAIYVDAINRAGGTAQLWDDWCVYLALYTPNAKNWTGGPSAVSKAHWWYLARI